MQQPTPGASQGRSAAQSAAARGIIKSRGRGPKPERRNQGRSAGDIITTGPTEPTERTLASRRSLSHEDRRVTLTAFCDHGMSLSRIRTQTVAMKSAVSAFAARQTATLRQAAVIDCASPGRRVYSAPSPPPRPPPNRRFRSDAVGGGGGGGGGGGARPSSPPLHPTASLSSMLSLDEFAIPEVPDTVHLTAGRRLVAIGDVHGDLDRLCRSLVVAGVMDENSARPRWVGGDAVCVQIGDVLDRGDDEVECLLLLADLARQAAGSGGAVAVLFGNHEVLNAQGSFRFATEGGDDGFEETIGALLDGAAGSDDWRRQFGGNRPARWAAMEPGGLLARPLLGNMKVAIVVGRTVLVHGGLTMPHLDYYGGGIAGMNLAARDWILRARHGKNNNLGDYATEEDAIRAAQARATAISESMPKCLGGVTRQAAPVWMRLYSYPRDIVPQNPLAQHLLDSVLSKLGVDRMVVGHTAQRQINAALQGKVWRIDVAPPAFKWPNKSEVEVLEVTLGEHGREEVWVLTESGRVPASERQTVENFFFC